MTFNWMKTFAAALALLFAIAVVPAARAASADPAVQQIQTFYDGLLDTMRHAKQLGVKGRYEKMKPVVEQAYDLTDMTGYSIGPSWAGLSDSDKQALVAAFERMTIASYAKNFDDYNGEKFEVDPNIQERGPDRIVMSKLVASDQTVPFTYRMREAGGSWKIVDVYLNGTISELATRRSDFASTLSTGGASALVKKINEIADGLMH
jgi:phospholipid transport system substrate-binding protein